MFINPNSLTQNSVNYQQAEVGVADLKGANKTNLKNGNPSNAVFNKLHLIKANGIPFNDVDSFSVDKFRLITIEDLCKAKGTALDYDIDDFAYCLDVGKPINGLITLRRFPFPCVANIWENENQGEPDIGRLIAYLGEEVNQRENLSKISASILWKELSADYEQASMLGEQSGYSGIMGQIMKVTDPRLVQNTLEGKNRLNYDPKHDQNKVHGPVDSLKRTNIRDVGLESQFELDLQFDYVIRSFNGRSIKRTFLDLMANILKVCYNDGAFWGGARYFTGERPGQFYHRYQYMNGTELDKILFNGFNDLKSTIGGVSEAQKTIETIKAIAKNGFKMAMGKMLDKIGRPSILVMNSLLNGEPTAEWHLTIGNPYNPFMMIGNLMMQNLEISFPGTSFTYEGVPENIRVNVKLKSGQDLDNAQIEMAFNAGKERIYYAPEKLIIDRSDNNVNSGVRQFFDFEQKEIDNTLSQIYKFAEKPIKSVLAKSSLVNDEFGSSENNTTQDNNTSNYDEITS